MLSDAALKPSDRIAERLSKKWVLSIFCRENDVLLQVYQKRLNRMASLNNIEDRSLNSSSAYQRREVGKVWWKSVINELLDSEKEDLEDLRILRRKLNDAESLRIVAGLLERKTERVIELNLLLRYRDKEKEEAAEATP